MKRVCVCGGCREWISPKAQSFDILVVVLRELIVVLSANGEGVKKNAKKQKNGEESP